MDKGTINVGGPAKQALDAIYSMLSVVNDERNRALVAEIFSQLDHTPEASLPLPRSPMPTPTATRSCCTRTRSPPT